MAKVPHLVQMQKDFGGDQFSVIGLMQGDTNAATHFSRSHKLNYPVLANSRDFDAFDILFVPVTYLVDPSGMIVADDLDDAKEILSLRFAK